VSGLLGLDGAASSGKVRFRIPVAYLRSGIDARDGQLQGADGLDAKAHPDLFFESVKAERKGPTRWAIEGVFTMKGVARPLTLEVETWELPAEVVKASKWGDVPGLGFRGEFRTKLSDHGIRLASTSSGTLSDVWTVRFNLVGLLEE
jgi:polyisoprenoid-binding protein YceI